jgi:hypothetical protein
MTSSEQVGSRLRVSLAQPIMRHRAVVGNNVTSQSRTDSLEVKRLFSQPDLLPHCVNHSSPRMITPLETTT